VHNDDNLHTHYTSLSCHFRSASVIWQPSLSTLISLAQLSIQHLCPSQHHLPHKTTVN